MYIHKYTMHRVSLHNVDNNITMSPSQSGHCIIEEDKPDKFTAVLKCAVVLTFTHIWMVEFI